MRTSGVLLHLSSLPGPFGIGTMGPEAGDFARYLAEAEQTWWQVLPFNQPAEASPYQARSAFAGNIWLIDPRWLRDLGLLEDEELSQFYYRDDPYRVDYAFVQRNSARYLGLAYSRLPLELRQEVVNFAAREQRWLRDYAVFTCVKEDYEGLPWWEWPNEALRRHDEEAISAYIIDQPGHVQFVYFCQWAFYRSWSETKQAINDAGIKVFGDIPIYMDQDSCDIWSHQEDYLLDKDLRPTVVAGVPPDYFAEDGQLWGNTIYDWEAMEEGGFAWWLDRIASSFRWYDMLRIDHFRGFESYWAVPESAETARHGRWYKGPGMKLFSKVRDELGNLPIVAEDLGQLSPAVTEFLAETGYPGMRVMQFGLTGSYDDDNLPHNYPVNSCSFSGTHDNDTTLGWLWTLNDYERGRALEYIGFPADEDWGRGGPDSPVLRAVIRQLWASSSDTTIVPVQDLCGFGSDTRMNTPGVPEGQWAFRVTEQALSEIDYGWLRGLTQTYCRRNPATMNREAAAFAEKGFKEGWMQGPPAADQPDQIALYSVRMGGM